MLNKLFSGRWILTLICGIVFWIVATRMIMPTEAVTAIITMVFVSYFQRQDRNNGGK